MQPKLVSTVAIPQAQMMKLTPDNKRLYVSNSLLSNLDGKVPYRVRLVNVSPPGMTLDAKFDVAFDHFPTGQARPHDMRFNERFRATPGHGPRGRGPGVA